MEFSLTVLTYVSVRDETKCVENVHNVSATQVAEFNFLTEAFDGECETSAKLHQIAYMLHHQFIPRQFI